MSDGSDSGDELSIPSSAGERAQCAEADKPRVDPNMDAIGGDAEVRRLRTVTGSRLLRAEQAAARIGWATADAGRGDTAERTNPAAMALWRRCLLVKPPLLSTTRAAA